MEPIAIVGMAAIFPGAADLDQYWHNLVTGRDMISDVPADRFDELFYDPDNAGRPDRLYTRRGGFLGGQTVFEPLKFGIMPQAVGDIEPDQLIALEVAAAAIADAGGAARMPDADKVGVILGRGGMLNPAASRYANRVRMASQVVGVLRELLPEVGEDRLDLVRARIDERLGRHRPEGTIGLVPNLAASRVANRLNLRGPAYTIDAACASSLIAVDQAMAELATGRLDAVLAGGVHHVHDISFWSVFSQLRALSHTGHIRPFDADADGVLIGEGTGIVVLKRLADAERDNDRVYAVLRGSGTSSDGRSASMVNPASSGQALAIRRAWEMAGLDPAAPDALGLLEAHGTATPTGDAAELVTVAEVFGPHTGAGEKPVIGSVKSMIGHAMPAAGVAGLIKATLAVHHGVLPPTLNVTTPRAEMARTRFQPISVSRPWQASGVRRAAVNAFGFGGINAHVIVEQYVPPRPPTAGVSEPERVLRLAASSVDDMVALLSRDDVRSLPVTAGGPVRLGLVDPTDQRIGIARTIAARGAAWRGGRDLWFTPRPLLGAGGGDLAFVFPGIEAEFAPRTADVAAHFGLPHRDWTATDLGRHGSGLVEVGRQLDTVLRRMNIHPDAVAGHSIGEWTAAAVTGQMTTAGVDTFLSVFDADSVEISGYAFAAVSAPAESIVPLLADYPGVVLSHDNAPTQCVVNGPHEQVQRLAGDLRARTVMCRLLPFRSAFHTPAFAEGLQSIGAALGRWEVRPTRVPVWSGTTSAPFPDDPGEVNRIFVRHMIEPVRFRRTVTAMYDAGIRVFLQLGAGQLASLVDDNLRDREHLAMPVNVSRRPGMAQLLRVATALWVDGGDPDFSALDVAPARPARVNLVAEPSARRGPAVKLDLGGPLVTLGEGADELLGLGNRTAMPVRQRMPAAGAQDAALAALSSMTGSSAATELAALLHQTASDAVKVIEAASPRTVRADGVHTSVLDVSVDRMPYLRDHCFFVQPVDWPRMADRWPVVPATTVVQHMMDAAERAAPGLRAVAVRDARFTRWLIAEPAQRVAITVKPAGPHLLTVIFGGYARSTVEMAADYPQPDGPPWQQDPATEFPPTTSAAQMYADRLMFHGPQFQGVTAVHALGDLHIRGIVTAPFPPGALLDNALQLIGNWLVTTQPFRTVALPVGLRHVRFYGPPPAPGTAFDCVARIRSITDGELIADTQLSVNGRVWAQIDGATDRRFDSHPTARSCERFPERYPMSQRHDGGWTVAFDAWTDLVTRGMAARGILGGDAAEEYERMPAARRNQWMLGRIAAKDAVRFRQWDAGHTDVYPIELTVRNEPGGRPYVALRPGRGFVESSVSIAHTAEAGVAIAGPAGTEVGIDIIEIRPRDESTYRYALTPAELAQATDDHAFARIWAAKEAAGKALGTGLDGAPRRFEVDLTAATVSAAGRTFTVRWQEIENPPELPARRYVVAWINPTT
ncbi:beta-ketoacyl synthase N-terminal-like domain-containing protein [Winogradskya humida]|uniref:Polyketide synthase n=1 Tax=Winogradskya humida TaxID=113566 RepID=A0ABQ3ZRD1_9ACTN|nr:beta-ketoacyl synthase N-terminal-like domain-containing protein [Actinoplanes humidus]GIE21126.1 polyketide synthase [Actinoplanes humidus]